MSNNNNNYIISSSNNLNDENISTIERSISSNGSSSGFAEESIFDENKQQKRKIKEEDEDEEEEEEEKRSNSVTNKSVLRIGIGLFGLQSNVEIESSPIDKLLARIFNYIGEWIAKRRIVLIILLITLTLISSSIIPFTPQQDDLKSGYTPLGAKSKEELIKYEQFFSPENEKTLTISEEQITLLVFICAKDNKSLLRDSLMEQTVQLIDIISNDFPLGGRPFNQFCTHFCQINEPIRQFSNGLSVRKRNLEILKNEEENLTNGGINLNLSFPFMSIFGHQIDLSPHFFGAEIDKNNGGELKSLHLALLQFKADKPNNVNTFEVNEWERKIVKYLHSEYKGELRPLVFSMGFVADEVVRTGMTIFPYLSVGFVIMCAFSICTVTLSGLHFRQFSRQKILMALIACCCPLLACSTALGLLFWFGVRFGTILCVSPFLVLAIGVDDAFLMLQSWQRICSVAEQNYTEEENKIEKNLQEKIEKLICKRMGQMLEDVGPSVTITSATNFLAFCIGIFTPTPEIQLFCAGNASAIFVDYIYQLFLFTPFLAISAKWEMNEKSKNNFRTSLPVQRRFFLKVSQKLAQFLRSYCRWISSGFTATLVATSLVIFWGLSARWASRAVPNITPRKLFLADSPLNEIIALKDEYIMPSYMPVSIFIEKVGDLNDQTKMRRIKSLIEKFENEPNNMGATFTHFWLRDYEQYLASEIVEEEEEEIIEENKTIKNKTKIKQQLFGYTQMSSFLEWPEYRHWNGFLRFNKKDGHLERFFVITAFHGPSLVEWNSRAHLLGRWRQIVDNYTDLGAFVWVEESQFLDQIETLVPATVQSSIATLLCMSIVCSLFMSNVFTVAIATICIVSICLGAFGLLVLWGIDLDPISMATTIMSIGFSVDFPAHVTYHYYRCSKFDDGRMLSPEQRVHEALLAIGFPLLQCGMSTILFVLCLLFVNTYMSEVFVKSMFLVVSLGLIHGLFVVPSMLCALSNINLLLESIKTVSF